MYKSVWYKYSQEERLPCIDSCVIRVTCALVDAKTLISKQQYLSKLRPRLKLLISDASYTFFRVFNMYFYSLFFSMHILSLF